MPIYKESEMEVQTSDKVEGLELKSVAGELIKVGFVTYQEGEGPPPHFHPNEEQFVLVLKGKFRKVLGDEETIIEEGDLVHIPRNTRHGVCAIDGPATFFAVKIGSFFFILNPKLTFSETVNHSNRAPC